ncbi:MAG: lysylphosphatidylglycerol synthase transmembrane domain-containing protein [Pseudomonadota bacterium]
MTEPRRGRALAWKAALGLVITLALFRLLFEFVDLEDLGALFRRLRWGPWLLGAVLWMGVYVTRTVRFRILAPQTPPWTMFWISSVHTLLLRLLPFRTGEISYGILLKRAGTAGLGESLLGLLLLRIMDATTVVVVFSGTLLIWGGSYLGDRAVGVAVAAGVGALGVVGILSLPRLFRWALVVARALAGALGVAETRLMALALERGAGAVEAVAAVDRRTLARLGLVSLLQWMLTFACFYAILTGFSTPVGLAQTILGATGSVVSGFLPVGGIGTFGTLEAGWALGFVLVGLDKAAAVATAFGVSLSTLTFSVPPALLGWWMLERSNRRREARA